MSHLKIQSKLSIYKLSILCVFLSSFIFLIWLAKYGFCFNDEPFCITLAHRLFSGDALIADEWHGTQNFGAVLLPFYSLFRTFASSNEGIILTFRYTYCLLWFLTCLSVYKTLSSFKFASVTVFLYLILFSPLDYMTLSYTSISLMSSLLICCILYIISHQKIHYSVFYSILFSVLWIIIVLCSPFMAIGYVAFVITVSVLYIWKKNHSENYYFKNLFNICKFSLLFISIIAALYILIFLLSRASVSEIIHNIPYIFKDPEHTGSMNPVTGIFNIVLSIFNNTPIFCIISFISFILGWFFKLSDKIKLSVFSACSFIYFYKQFDLIKTPVNSYFNYQVLYIVILGFVAYSLLQKKPYKLFMSFGLFGCLYTVFNNITSNTGLMSISMSLSVSGVFSIICIFLLFKELYCSFFNKHTLQFVSAVLISTVLIMQISTQTYIRFQRTYWDESLNNLSTRITCGAAKGLYTTDYRAAAYETTYNNLTRLLAQTDTCNKKFLSCTSAPYIYLDADLDFATFSAWSFGYGDNLNNRLIEYYSVNPDNVPDLIFCATENDILTFINSNYSQIEHNGSFLFVRQ